MFFMTSMVSFFIICILRGFAALREAGFQSPSRKFRNNRCQSNPGLTGIAAPTAISILLF